MESPSRARYGEVNYGLLDKGIVGGGGWDEVGLSRPWITLLIDVKYQCPRRYVSELSLSGRKWLGSLCSRVAEIFFFSNDEHHFLQCGGELGLSGLKGIEWFRGILDVIEGQDIDKKTISVRNTTMSVLQTGPNTSSPVNISNAFRTVWVGIRLYLTRSSL